jgi:hypothetical protein
MLSRINQCLFPTRKPGAVQESYQTTPWLGRSSNIYDSMFTGMQRRRAKTDNSGAVVVSGQGGGFQPTGRG